MASFRDSCVLLRADKVTRSSISHGSTISGRQTSCSMQHYKVPRCILYPSTGPVLLDVFDCAFWNGAGAAVSPGETNVTVRCST